MSVIAIMSNVSNNKESTSSTLPVNNESSRAPLKAQKLSFELSCNATHEISMAGGITTRLGQGYW